MINYKHLKTEEKEVITTFKGFLLETINFFETKFNSFIARQNAEEMFDDAIDIDKKNNMKCRDIQDDCIWFIQKNEPRANHLRLIIAIINSLSDIRRISNYTVTFCKFYNKCSDEIKDESFKIIKPLGANTIQTIKKLYQLVNDFELDTLKKEAKKVFEEHIKWYKNYFYDSIKKFLEINEKAKYIANAVIVVKNFDRTVDHMMNVIDNLVSVL